MPRSRNNCSRKPHCAAWRLKRRWESGERWMPLPAPGITPVVEKQQQSGVGCQGQQLSKTALGNCWTKSGNSPLTYSCFCLSGSYLLLTTLILTVFYYYSEFISSSVACPQTCKLTQTAWNHRQLASSQNSYPK